MGRSEIDVSVAALAEALQALDAVHGDLQRLKKDRPDLEPLMPHLELANSLTTLRGVPPSDAAKALRNELVNRARQMSENEASDPERDQSK